MSGTTESDNKVSLNPDDFCRRVNYVHGHLDAVARMVSEGHNHSEVLHQIRAVRRATEKLEAYCLLSLLDDELGGLTPDVWRTLLQLYRRLNR